VTAFTATADSISLTYGCVEDVQNLQDPGGARPLGEATGERLKSLRHGRCSEVSRAKSRTAWFLLKVVHTGVAMLATSFAVSIRMAFDTGACGNLNGAVGFHAVVPCDG
jgi:hypothetical protein